MDKKPMNSLATFSTTSWTKIDQIYSVKALIRNYKKNIKELTKALGYRKLEDRYRIWREYFWSGDYEDYGPDIEFPEFYAKYGMFVRQKIKDNQERLTEAIKDLEEVIADKEEKDD